jgi:hypothetical protein
VDFTPTARFGHCVPVAADIGEVPASVVIVEGSAIGVCWANPTGKRPLNKDSATAIRNRTCDIGELS